MTRLSVWKRSSLQLGSLLTLAICLSGFALVGCGPQGPEPVGDEMQQETAPGDQPAPADAEPSDAVSTPPSDAGASADEPPATPPMTLTEVPGQGGDSSPAEGLQLPGMQLPDVPKETSISPEAQPLLDAMRAAYQQLEGLEVNGQVNVAVIAGPETENEVKKFNAAFQAPNKFRHEGEEEMVIGSDGTKAYLYASSENIYMTFDLPNQERSIEAFPPQIVQMLQMQNPAVFFALTEMPIEEVLGPGVQIAKLDDETVADKTYNVLQFTLPDNNGSSRMFVDPETHLLRRIVTDMSPAMRQRGMNVEKAELTIDYTTVSASPEFAPDAFAWTPPEGAMNLAEARRRQQEEAEREQMALQQMPGQPAPDFTLTDLQGQQVSLASQQGNVVVLDFWATWCGPCVASLPHLAEMAKEYADQGVQLLAVNIQESEEDISAFLENQNLELTVLLDKEGDVAGKYHVSGIPQTVVVGKDGLVRKVIVGSGQQEAITAEVEAALAGKPIETVPASEETPAGDEPSSEASSDEPAMPEPGDEKPVGEASATDADGDSPAVTEESAEEMPAPPQ